MLFGIETDSGAIISGYAVPDGVSGSLMLSVSANGVELLVFEANEGRPSLVIGGRHDTGACGYTITEQQIPGLHLIDDLEIKERNSGILLHRRSRPDDVQKKVLRLETHLFPLWRLDNQISNYFQHFAANIDTFGRETTTQLFLLANVQSVFLSGRIMIQNYSYFIDGKFDVIAMVQDPYEEMAERLIILSQMRNARLPHLGDRDYMILGPVIDFVQNINFDHDTSINTAFADPDEDIYAFFNDPLTRLLTANNPHEPASNTKMALALETLSSFSVLGQRSDPDAFIEACAEFLGLPPHYLPPIPRFPRVAAVAEKLRANPVVGYMLEKDRELYSHVAKAFATSNEKVG